MIFLSIDLQKIFLGGDQGECFPTVVKTAQAEALRARRYKYGAILLECKGYGRTVSPIYELLHDYDKLALPIKEEMDGGREVLAAILDNKYDPDIIRVCGVNTDQCVFHTVQTIHRLSYKSDIILLKDGCGTNNNYNKNDFSIFKSMKKVHIM